MPEVIRNDAMSAADVIKQKPSGIVLSPGPCDPDQAGICLELIGLAAENNIPLLGVCLGHQSIGQYFGGQVVRAPAPMHGKVSSITHDGDGLFHDIPSPILITRYHSLTVEKESIPDCLKITATSDDDHLVMAIQHKNKPIYGAQFHPESIKSEHGMNMLKNFTDKLS